MDLSLAALAFIAVASVIAGIMNAVAGGGTLLAFPAMTVTGILPVEANVGTTVALTPGYLGGTLAQQGDLFGQRSRLVRLVPCGVLGGAIGAALLRATTETVFRAVVPWLIFAACGLLLAQDRIRGRVERRAATRDRARHESGVGLGAMAAVVGAGIYGGYFGGALGIALLAILGAVIDDDLRRINAIKQLLSLATNATASMVLVFSALVPWVPVVVMAVGSLIGGAIGGRVASRLDPRLFRGIVVVIGAIVAMIYLFKN